MPSWKAEVEKKHYPLKRCWKANQILASSVRPGIFSAQPSWAYRYCWWQILSLPQRILVSRSTQALVCAHKNLKYWTLAHTLFFGCGLKYGAGFGTWYGIRLGTPRNHSSSSTAAGNESQSPRGLSPRLQSTSALQVSMARQPLAGTRPRTPNGAPSTAARPLPHGN